MSVFVLVRPGSGGRSTGNKRSELEVESEVLERLKRLRCHPVPRPRDEPEQNPLFLLKRHWRNTHELGNVDEHAQDVDAARRRRKAKARADRYPQLRALATLRQRTIP